MKALLLLQRGRAQSSAESILEPSRLREAHICFNGAALNRARKEGRLTLVTATPVRFNGAALNRARKEAVLRFC